MKTHTTMIRNKEKKRKGLDRLEGLNFLEKLSIVGNHYGLEFVQNAAGRSTKWKLE